MDTLLIRADARCIPIADRSVHCVVTSPPYFALRDYGVDGQIGLEETPEDYVAAMVGVFREVRRILRDDGTLWLNVGDSYNAYNGNRGASTSFQAATEGALPSLPAGNGLTVKGLKAKDLVGIPWMLAFALRADGWYLRSEIIWSKPNPMPESVTDRPSKAHEQVFLLAKRPSYFFDAEAVREPFADDRMGNPNGGGQYAANIPGQRPHGGLSKGVWTRGPELGGRNCRSVWSISVQPFKGAHFATMPPALAERCIKAGTSERGVCPACGAPWVRVVERDRVPTRPGVDSKVHAVARNGLGHRVHHPEVVGNRDPQRHCTATRTAGWEPGCDCGRPGTAPAVVFDPFGGAATTAHVARRLGRRAVATELNPDYLAIAQARLRRPADATPTVKPLPGQMSLFTEA